MTFIGLDPGLDGGIAFIRDDGNASAEVMPTLAAKKGRELDEKGVLEAVEYWQHESVFAVIEAQHPMPKQGTVSTFSLGKVFGALRMALAACGIPYQVVPAQTWQKAVGISGKLGDTKRQSVAVAQRLFPDVDLRATPRCRKAHDGLADALLIAEYARRLRAGQQAA